MRLLDPRFKYIPAARTDVAATWRRFGFKPMTDAERRSRKLRSGDSTVPADDARTSVAPRRPRRPTLALAVNANE
jgi:hypothetical protein